MNILWLTLDHLTFRHYRLNKGAKPILSTYERLGRQGVTFTQCKSTHPLCTPARASMLTGVYTHKHRILRNNDDLRSEYAPATSTLKEAGYRLGYFGKNHSTMDLAAAGFEGYFPPSYGNPFFTPEYRAYLDRKGLPDPIFNNEWSIGNRFKIGEDYNLLETDYFNNYTCGYFKTPGPYHETDFLLDMAGNWLRERAKDKEDFVLRLDVWGPHQSYQIPYGFKDKTYNDADIEPYPGFDEVSLPYKARVADMHLKSLRERGGVMDSWDEWRPIVKRAYENYTYIDMQLGWLIDELERLGLSQNTAIILTADHGDALASHGGMFDKCGDMAEELMDIPMVISAPGLPKGICNNSLTSNLDVVPTVLDLAGASQPYEMDGISLKQVALGKKERSSLLCEHYGHFDYYFRQRAVYEGYWKYVETENDKDQLYNLEEDPYELRNYATDCPDILLRMKDLLGEMAVKYADFSY